MSRTHRRVAARRIFSLASIGSLALLCAVVLAERSTGAAMTGVLYLLPALLLGLALLSGRYPGESALKRLRGACASPTPRPLSSRPSRRPAARLSRGGRLIAVSLAGRAPPPAAACC